MRWSLSSKPAALASALLASGALLGSSAYGQFYHDAADKAEGYNTRLEENAHGSMRSIPQGADTGDYDVYADQDYSGQPQYQTNPRGSGAYVQGQGQYAPAYGQPGSQRPQQNVRRQSNDPNAYQNQAQNQGQANRFWQNPSAQGWRDNQNQANNQQNQAHNQNPNFDQRQGSNQTQWTNQGQIANRRAYSSNQSSLQQQDPFAHGQSGQNQADQGAAFSNDDGRLTARRVAQNSPLGQAGLRRGDQIESINGQQVRSQDDLRQALHGAPRWALVIVRNGQRHTLNGVHAGQGNWNQNQNQSYAHQQQQFGGGAYGQQQYGNQPNGNQQASFAQNQGEFTITSRLARGAQGQSFLGVQLDQRVQNEAVVSHIYRGSPAEQAGVQPGDVLMAINGQQISSPNQVSQVVAHFNPGTPVQLVIERHEIAGGRAQMGQRDANQQNWNQGQQNWNQGRQGWNSENQPAANPGFNQRNQEGSRYQSGYRGEQGSRQGQNFSLRDAENDSPQDDSSGDMTSQ